MLPDLSVFWVVGLVLALAVILNRLVFEPILQVIKKREDAVTAARVLADQAAAEARAAAEESERKPQRFGRVFIARWTKCDKRL